MKTFNRDKTSINSLPTKLTSTSLRKLKTIYSGGSDLAKDLGIIQQIEKTDVNLDNNLQSLRKRIKKLSKRVVEAEKGKLVKLYENPGKTLTFIRNESRNKNERNKNENLNKNEKNKNENLNKNENRNKNAPIDIVEELRKIRLEKDKYKNKFDESKMELFLKKRKKKKDLIEKDSTSSSSIQSDDSVDFHSDLPNPRKQDILRMIKEKEAGIRGDESDVETDLSVGGNPLKTKTKSGILNAPDLKRKSKDNVLIDLASSSLNKIKLSASSSIQTSVKSVLRPRSSKTTSQKKSKDVIKDSQYSTCVTTSLANIFGGSIDKDDKPTPPVSVPEYLEQIKTSRIKANKKKGSKKIGKGKNEDVKESKLKFSASRSKLTEEIKPTKPSVVLKKESSSRKKKKEHVLFTETPEVINSKETTIRHKKKHKSHHHHHHKKPSTPISPSEPILKPNQKPQLSIEIPQTAPESKPIDSTLTITKTPSLSGKEACKKIQKNNANTLVNLNAQMSTTLQESIAHMNDICMRVRTTLSDMEKDQFKYNSRKRPGEAYGSECESVIEGDFSVVSIHIDKSESKMENLKENPSKFTTVVKPIKEDVGLDRIINSISMQGGDIVVDDEKDKDKKRKKKIKKDKKTEDENKSIKEKEMKEIQNLTFSERIQSPGRIRIPIWERKPPSVINDIQLMVKRQATRSQYKEFMRNLKRQSRRTRSVIESSQTSCSDAGNISVKQTNKDYNKLKENLDKSKVKCSTCSSEKCTCGVIVENVLPASSTQKMQWIKTRSALRRGIQAYDILDEITLKDVEPLQSEYPRKDHIFNDESHIKVEDTLLYRLLYNESPHILESFIKSTESKTSIRKPSFSPLTEPKPDVIRPNLVSKAYQLYEKLELGNDQLKNTNSDHSDVKSPNIKAPTTVKTVLERLRSPMLKQRPLQSCPKDFNDNLNIPKDLFEKVSLAETKKRVKKCSKCTIKLTPEIDLIGDGEKRKDEKKSKKEKLINKGGKKKNPNTKKFIKAKKKEYIKPKLKNYLIDPANMHFKNILTVMRVSVLSKMRIPKLQDIEIKDKRFPKTFSTKTFSTKTFSTNQFSTNQLSTNRFSTNQLSTNRFLTNRSLTNRFSEFSFDISPKIEISKENRTKIASMSKKEVVKKLMPYIFLDIQPKIITVMPVFTSRHLQSQQSQKQPQKQPQTNQLSHQQSFHYQSQVSSRLRTERERSGTAPIPTLTSLQRERLNPRKQPSYRDHGDSSSTVYRKFYNRCQQMQNIIHDPLLQQPQLVTSPPRIAQKRNTPTGDSNTLKKSPIKSKLSPPKSPITIKKPPQTLQTANTEVAMMTRKKLNEVKSLVKQNKDYFPKDLNKAIEGIEFKIVNVLSNPVNKHNEAFLEIEEEIRSILTNMGTNNLTNNSRKANVKRLREDQFLKNKSPSNSSTTTKSSLDNNNENNNDNNNDSNNDNNNENNNENKSNDEDILLNNNVNQSKKDTLQQTSLENDNNNEIQFNDKIQEPTFTINPLDEDIEKAIQGLDALMNIGSSDVSGIESNLTTNVSLIESKSKEPGDRMKGVSSFCAQVDEVINKINSVQYTDVPTVRVEILADNDRNLEEISPEREDNQQSSDETIRSDDFLTPYMKAVKDYRKSERSQSLMDFLDKLSKLSSQEKVVSFEPGLDDESSNPSLEEKILNESNVDLKEFDEAILLEKVSSHVHFLEPILSNRSNERVIEDEDKVILSVRDVHSDESKCLINSTNKNVSIDVENDGVLSVDTYCQATGLQDIGHQIDLDKDSNEEIEDKLENNKIEDKKLEDKKVGDSFCNLQDEQIDNYVTKDVQTMPTEEIFNEVEEYIKNNFHNETDEVIEETLSKQEELLQEEIRQEALKRDILKLELEHEKLMLQDTQQQLSTSSAREEKEEENFSSIASSNPFDVFDHETQTPSIHDFVVQTNSADVQAIELKETAINTIKPKKDLTFNLFSASICTAQDPKTPTLVNVSTETVPAESPMVEKATSFQSGSSISQVVSTTIDQTRTESYLADLKEARNNCLTKNTISLDVISLFESPKKNNDNNKESKEETRSQENMEFFTPENLSQENILKNNLSQENILKSNLSQENILKNNLSQENILKSNRSQENILTSNHSQNILKSNLSQENASKTRKNHKKVQNDDGKDKNQKSNTNLDIETIVMEKLIENDHPRYGILLNSVYGVLFTIVFLGLNMNYTC